MAAAPKPAADAAAAPAAPIGAAGFDRFLYLLGRLNYSWTNTESLLIHLIAGLSKTDKDSALVIFLTLNTTRARVDLVERLSKLERVPAEQRDVILAATRRMLRLAGMRNLYNHCIYSVDAESGGFSAIRMRVADRRTQIKVGERSDLDSATLEQIESSLADLAALNNEIWSIVKRYDYPV